MRPRAISRGTVVLLGVVCTHSGDCQHGAIRHIGSGLSGTGSGQDRPVLDGMPDRRTIVLVFSDTVGRSQTTVGIKGTNGTRRAGALSQHRCSLNTRHPGLSLVLTCEHACMRSCPEGSTSGPMPAYAGILKISACIVCSGCHTVTESSSDSSPTEHLNNLESRNGPTNPAYARRDSVIGCRSWTQTYARVAIIAAYRYGSWSFFETRHSWDNKFLGPLRLPLTRAPIATGD